MADRAYFFFTAGCSALPKRIQIKYVSMGRSKQIKSNNFRYGNGSALTGREEGERKEGGIIRFTGVEISGSRAPVLLPI
jgi:hypothetical protein